MRSERRRRATTSLSGVCLGGTVHLFVPGGQGGQSVCRSGTVIVINHVSAIGSSKMGLVGLAYAYDLSYERPHR